jgi:PAS domain S-box-containing protein
LVKQPAWVRYLATASLVALAALVRWPLDLFLHGAAPYAFYFLAVLISAWYWGAGTAVFASILSALVSVGARLLDHDSRVDPQVGVSLIPFAITCAGMVLMARAARFMRNREERADGYLAAIIHSSDDAIVSKDLNGIIQSCNPACEALFGYEAGELIGRPITVLIPPELQHQEQDILARLRRGERIDHFDTVRVTKDGQRLDVMLTISPVRSASGEIIGASKIARNVTAIRKAERALAAQQEWFRVTLSSIGDAVIATDPEGKVTFLNEPAERLTGWERALAQDKPLSEIFHIVNEKTREPVESPIIKVIRTGYVVGLANHTMLIRRDGAEIPIADSAAPIRDAQGGVLGVVMVFHDVTETRRAEEAIAEQREWLERTLESIGDAVIATDVQCNVTFMNPVAEHLTGWTSKEAFGRDCEEVFRIVNEKSRRQVENPVKRVLEQGAVVGLANHTLLISRDGVERPIDDSGAPIRNLEGRVVGVVLVFRDVAERRRMEMERHTANLERERLLDAERVARSEAERANRVKDDFMAMVSHELRTPLNAIVGWAQLLLAAPPDEASTRRGLEVIGRNARIQAQLISDLLDVSRIVSGKLLLDTQNVNLTSVIESAIETVDPSADAKRITIVRRLDHDPATALTMGDPARLQQVIWNLLSNAIKFTPEGGRVEVELKRVESKVEISVSDTGAGIEPQLLDKIFDRFYQQQDGPTTRRHGGLGLGLSIVRHLVELHGGSVRAWSDGEGKGATFTVVLPHFEPRPTEGLDARGGAAASVAMEDHRLRNVRVLVVEDEADTRDLLRRVLETHGAEVATVASAAAAREAVAARVPDILVSDIGLPDVDGYQLIRELRANPSTNAMPAIALTAFARSEERTRALRAGYQVHIAKPVEPAELIATVASLVGLARRD